MDLLRLAAKIELDDSQYRKGISSAESAGQKLGQSMSSMAVTVGNAIYDLMRRGVQAIGGVVKGAMDGYADYQQLIGGVETLFGRSADKVAKYAKQSFKTAGLSANDYMETVTSFSASLLQGLKGDTDAAADLANLAIIDMSDNANKMGTDMQSIQNAYMGFAKGNYTMLDNLKLGYGGTKSEMLRLVNDSGVAGKKVKSLDDITFPQLIQAIHEIQTEMGVTGTTAEEAELTISGRANAMKAAWQDMLTAIGGQGEDGDALNLDAAMANFKETFTRYVDGIIPTMVSTVTGSGKLVEAIADGIAQLPKDLLSQLGKATMEGGSGIVGGIGTIANWILDNLINMFRDISVDSSKAQEFGESIGTFIGETLSKIAKNADDIIAGAITLGVSLSGGLLQGLFEGLFGQSETEAEKVSEAMNDALTGAEVNSGKATAIIEYMQSLVNTYGDGAEKMQEFKTAQEQLQEVMGEDAGKVFEDYAGDIRGALTALQDLAVEERKRAITKAYQTAIEELTSKEAEQELARSRARAEKGIAEAGIERQQGSREASLMAYAQEAAGLMQTLSAYSNSNERFGNVYGGFKELDTGMVTFLTELSQGKFGEGTVGEMSAEDRGYWMASLSQTLESYYRIIDDYNEAMERENSEERIEYGTQKELDGQAYNTKVWDEDIQDKILPPEQLQGVDAEIQRLKQQISDADAAIAEANRQSEAIQEERTVVLLAMQQTAQQMAEEATNLSTTLNSSGDTLYKATYDMSGNLLSVATVSKTSAGDIGDLGDAAEEAAEKLGNFKAPGVNANGADDQWEPRAIGIDYVPRDGFKAELHRGEAVLTAAENRRRRDGGVDMDQLAAVVEGAIRTGMQGANVRSYLNGRDITQSVSTDMMRQLRARRFG